MLRWLTLTCKSLSAENTLIMKESMVSKKYTSLIGEKYAIFNLKNLDFQKMISNR